MTTKTIGNRTGLDFSGTEDDVIISGLPNTNLPTETGSGGAPFLIRFTGLSGITPPVTVTDAFITLNCTTGNVGAGTWTFKRILRSWVEVQATWNEWKTSNSWTTAGCLGDGTDRVSSDSCVVNYPGGFATGDFNSSSNAGLIADVQAIINGTLSNEGWRVELSEAVGLPANATPALRPMLTVTFDSVVNGTGSPAAQAASLAGVGLVTGLVLGATIFLYPGEINQNDVRLTNPLVVASNSIAGSGALVAGNSSTSGVGTSRSTGTGVLVAQSSTIVGVGTVSTPLTITGTGALLAQASTLSGAGKSSSTGTGVLLSQGSSLIGVGTGRSTGTGALSDQSASAAGAGSAYWLARSGLYSNPDGFYTIGDGTGFYALGEVRIISGDSQISGVGISSSTATGALVSGAAQVQGQELVAEEEQPSKFRYIIRSKHRPHKSSHREMDELLDRVFNPTEEPPPAPLVEQVAEIVRPFVVRNELNLSKLYKDITATQALLRLWEAENARARIDSEDEDESVLLVS